MVEALQRSWEEALVEKVFAGIDFDASGEIDKVRHSSSVSK